MIVGAVYRHPITNFNEFQFQFETTLKSIGNNKYEFIVCGDFNIDY